MQTINIPIAIASTAVGAFFSYHLYQHEMVNVKVMCDKLNEFGKSNYATLYENKQKWNIKMSSISAGIGVSIISYQYIPYIFDV